MFILTVGLIAVILQCIFFLRNQYIQKHESNELKKAISAIRFDGWVVFVTLIGTAFLLPQMLDVNEHILQTRSPDVDQDCSQAWQNRIENIKTLFSCLLLLWAVIYLQQSYLFARLFKVKVKDD